MATRHQTYQMPGGIWLTIDSHTESAPAPYDEDTSPYGYIAGPFDTTIPERQIIDDPDLTQVITIDEDGQKVTVVALEDS